MSFIGNLYETAKKNNILGGIIFIDLIAFISYIIFPFGIFYFGDLHMIIGCIVGIYFTLKHMKPNQSVLILSILTGFIGSILTAVSYTLFDWILFLGILKDSPFMLLVISELFLIEAIIIGLIMGLIIGIYYNRRSKNLTESTSIEEEFYDGLKDK